MNPLPTHVNGQKIASFLSGVQKQKDPEKQALLEKLLEALNTVSPKKCYYCSLDKFRNSAHYERHVILNHSGKLCYPNSAYLKAKNLKPQNCLWEE